MVTRKVSMKKRVRMVLRAFMLMNVQKRRLKKQDRQREIHQYGNTTLHNAYRTLKFKARGPHRLAAEATGIKALKSHPDAGYTCHSIK